MESPTPTPKKAAPGLSSTPQPGEDNHPPHDPMRRAVERETQEPSNVRPSNDPTPEKGTPIQKAGDGQAGDADVQGG